MIRLGISGATGKFGRAILTEVAPTSDIELVAAITTSDDVAVPDFPEIRTRSSWDLTLPVDVVLDVSVAEGTLTALAHALECGIPFVTGVTGLTERHRTALRNASSTIPVLAAPNFSVGVAALLKHLSAFSRALQSYDVSMIDLHHKAKRDAPSGTGVLLLDALNSGRAPDMQLNESMITSIRIGGNPGQHTITFASSGEEISVSHRAISRACFASGAVLAVQWIIDQPPGLYEMADVLT